MAVVVPDWKRTEPDESLVRAGVFPSAQTWQSLGQLTNWLLAQGACVVAGSACTQILLVDGDDYTFHFLTKPREIAVQRVWMLQCRIDVKAATPTPNARLGVKIPVGASTVWYPVSDSRASFPILFVEDVATPSDSVQDLAIYVTPDNADVWLEGIRCFEVPRAALKFPDDDGVDIATERAGQRIVSALGRSVGGPALALSTPYVDPRRVALFHLSVPAEDPLTRTTNSYADVLALPVPLLVPKLGRTATKQTVYWSAYIKTTAGGTVNVKVTTSHSGVDDSTSTSGTTYAWTTKRPIAVDCEDMESEDGRQTAASPQWDELQIAIKGDGVRAISLAGLAVWSEETVPAVPTVATAPVISLNSDWAQLACTTGTWSGAPTSYSYQWKRAGVAIAGATGSTYNTTGNNGSGATDYGPAITCEVVATNGFGPSSASASNTLAYLPTAEGAVCKRFLDPSLLSNGAVATWADQTGAPSYAQGTGGKQPVKSATSLNGTPGVTFDGVDDYLITGAALDLSAQSGMRVLFSAIDTTAGASLAIVLGHESAALFPGAKGFALAVNDGVADTIEGAANGTGVAAAMGAAYGSESLASARVIHVGYNTANANGLSYIRSDGSSLSLTNAIAACVSGDVGNEWDIIGIHIDGASFPWAGVMGVLVYLTGTAADAVSARVEQFIAWRTGKAPL